MRRVQQEEYDDTAVMLQKGRSKRDVGGGMQCETVICFVPSRCWLLATASCDGHSHWTVSEQQSIGASESAAVFEAVIGP